MVSCIRISPGYKAMPKCPGYATANTGQTPSSCSLGTTACPEETGFYDCQKDTPERARKMSTTARRKVSPKAKADSGLPAAFSQESFRLAKNDFKVAVDRFAPVILR